MEYLTHTGLKLSLTQEEDQHVVSIHGERDKRLLVTRDAEAAEKFYASLVAHYEARKAAEA